MPASSVSWRNLLVVGLLYLLLLVWWAWPLFAHFSTGFVGLPAGDANQYVWNAFNFRRQLLAGANPWFTPLLLYPQGTLLVMHTYTPIIGLANVLIGHELLATNLMVAVSFVLSGVGGYRLCVRWVSNPVLCGLAGVVFAFSPYKLAHLPEHYHLLLTATVPFYVVAFLKAFLWQEGRWLPQVRSWAQVALCGVLGLVTLLSDYYTLFGLLYFSVGYALYYGLKLSQIRWGQWQTWAWLVAGLVVCHIGSRLLKLSDVPDNAGFWWGGDLAGYLLPPLNNRWLRTAATDALHRRSIFNMPGSVENVMFLGYALPLLLLLSYALKTRRPTHGAPPAPVAADWRPLPWLLLLFVLLTLPEIRVFGKGVLRLPTGLLHYVPFFNNIRCPTRHVSFVALLLPLVAFVRWQPWLQTRLRPATQWMAAASLLAVVLLELQPQTPPVRTVAGVPRVYQVVRELPGATVFPVPFGLLDGYRQLGRMSPDELFYQTRHGKALAGAYISRVPAATFDSFARQPVLRVLLHSQTKPDTVQPAPPTAAQLQEFLRVYRPAAFVVSPAYQNKPVHQLLRRLLAPYGYQEQRVDDYVLLAPAAR
jgi:hypothetical protein